MISSGVCTGIIVWIILSNFIIFAQLETNKDFMRKFKVQLSPHDITLYSCCYLIPSWNNAWDIVTVKETRKVAEVWALSDVWLMCAGELFVCQSGQFWWSWQEVLGWETGHWREDDSQSINISRLLLPAPATTHQPSYFGIQTGDLINYASLVLRLETSLNTIVLILKL